MLNLHGYGPSIIEGTILTLEVSAVSLLFAMSLGMIGALAKLSSYPPLKMIAQLYTTIIRGIPDLVLMLLIFFGGQVFINRAGAALGNGALRHPGDARGFLVDHRGVPRIAPDRRRCFAADQRWARPYRAPW